MIFFLLIKISSNYFTFLKNFFTNEIKNDLLYNLNVNFSLAIIKA